MCVIECVQQFSIFILFPSNNSEAREVPIHEAIRNISTYTHNNIKDKNNNGLWGSSTYVIGFQLRHIHQDAPRLTQTGTGHCFTAVTFAVVPPIPGWSDTSRSFVHRQKSWNAWRLWRSGLRILHHTQLRIETLLAHIFCGLFSQWNRSV